LNDNTETIFHKNSNGLLDRFNIFYHNKLGDDTHGPSFVHKGESDGSMIQKELSMQSYQVGDLILTLNKEGAREFSKGGWVCWKTFTVAPLSVRLLCFPTYCQNHPGVTSLVTHKTC